MSIAFDSAMKISRLIPREIAMHIGFEIPVQSFERIIQDAIDAAQQEMEPTTAPQMNSDVRPQR